MSLSFLTDKASALSGVCSMPEGWVIVPDKRTDNLLVHDGERGFGVSAVCLADWSMDRIVADVNKAAAEIYANSSTDVVPFFTLDELNAQAGG